jgi:hypothetical protein
MSIAFVCTSLFQSLEHPRGRSASVNAAAAASPAGGLRTSTQAGRVEREVWSEAGKAPGANGRAPAPSGSVETAEGRRQPESVQTSPETGI